MSTTLTRSQFQEACKAYIDKHNATAGDTHLSIAKNAHGWTWNEHTVRSVADTSATSLKSDHASPGLHITHNYAPLRCAQHSKGADEENWLDLSEAENDCATSPSSSEVITSRQYVIYSPTYQVPAFYFTVHSNNGAPLPLADIVRSSLLRSSSLTGTQATSYALTDLGSSFPLLSQGDHPLLGTPSWYLHPCHTAEVVGEVMAEVQRDDWVEADRLLRWIEAWFMVLEQVVDLRSGSLVCPSFTAQRRLASFVRQMSSHEVVIVAASRTPVGSLNGVLKSLTAPQLGIVALKHAFEQSKVDPSVVEEIYFGNVVQAGVGQSPARQVALGAGMSSASDATTINKVCASGMKAVILAAQTISTGYKSAVAAGGMESMSNAPYLLPRQNPTFGKFEVKDALQNDGLWDVYNDFAMGNCGEVAAEKFQITREAQDAHAIESFRRAERAWKAGVFSTEIAPVTIKGKKGDTVVTEDEQFKRVIYEKIPTLSPSFKKGGTITAANSSPLNDGASALILMSAEKAQELGVKPLAKIISYADVGVDPIDFPIAPTIALPKALEQANLKVEDIALFEINEAFSAVIRIAEGVMGIHPEKINVNGGAVALGHAIGNSGSRIVVSLVHALKSGEYGAAGVCNGGGAASAIVVQKL